MENEFPPNSHTMKDARPPRPSERTSEPKKEVTAVASGKVTMRKKPLYRKFLEAFRPEDGSGFIEYTVLEVFVPGIKNSIADATTEAIENALGVGHGGRSRRSRRDSGGYTSYNRMGAARRRDPRDRDDDRRRDSRRDIRPSDDDLREIIIDSRVVANEVLDNMFELLSKYDVATKRDLLSLLGEPHSFTDEDWGWTDLRGARVHSVRGGYLLDLPRPIPLD